MKQIKEFRVADRPDWGRGPWDDEPDKIHWIDPKTDMDCLMVRHETLGHWCGYVGVTEGHPLFLADYTDADISVHGGLTFGHTCAESEDPARGVCHVPFEGRPDHVFWLGFDCAHAGDVSPGLVANLRAIGHPILPSRYFGPDVYRDRRYVEREVRRLAKQLRAMT